VDDGSDDTSWEVMQRLSEQNEAIRIYQNKKGMGVCFTRNQMIDLAQKKYIWFVDADDLLVPGCAARLLSKAEERSADVLFGRVWSFLDEDEDKLDLTEVSGKGTGEITEADPEVPWSFFATDQYNLRSCGIWNGLYRKEFLDVNHIRFHEELVRGEDYTFIYDISMVPEKRCMLADIYAYCYRLRPIHYTTQSRTAFHILCVNSDIASLEALNANPNSKRPENRTIVRDYTVGTTQDIMLCMLKITDVGFVRKTLKYLRANGYFPYKYIKNTRNIKMPKKFEILAYEPVFRLYYPIKLVKIYRGDAKREKERAAENGK